MRIVYVINSIKRSGPNQVLLNMVSGIKGKDYDIKVVAFFDGDQNEANKLEQLNAQVDVLGVSKRNIVTDGAKKLRQYLDEFDPDVVHSHGILSDIAVIRAGYRLKSVTTVHNDMFEDYIFSFGKLKGFLYIWLHILYLRKFSQVVCCSSSAHKRLKRYIKRCVFIHNGIASVNGSRQANNRNRLTFRARLGVQAKDKIFLYVGRLNSRKNVVELLELFKNTHLPDEHLVIVGDGELASDCGRYACKNIHIEGFHSDIYRFYQVADVYVSASLAEGFSISVLEALQYNLILLLSDIPAHSEVFKVDESMYIGELFSNDTFAVNKAKLVYGGRDSVKCYQKYFTDTAMMSLYNKVYKKVMR